MYNIWVCIGGVWMSKEEAESYDQDWSWLTQMFAKVKAAYAFTFF